MGSALCAIVLALDWHPDISGVQSSMQKATRCAGSRGQRARGIPTGERLACQNPDQCGAHQAVHGFDILVLLTLSVVLFLPKLKHSWLGEKHLLQIDLPRIVVLEPIANCSTPHFVCFAG